MYSRMKTTLTPKYFLPQYKKKIIFSFATALIYSGIESELSSHFVFHWWRSTSNVTATSFGERCEVRTFEMELKLFKSVQFGVFRIFHFKLKLGMNV